MPNYRRYFVPGGTYFFTIVSYRRRPLFADPADVQRLRDALASVQRETPFRFLAGVVLPDPMHFLWTLPPGDDRYSRRLGRIHYNPVKHGLATCPHAWPASSFSRWVASGQYEPSWGCSCRGSRRPPRDFTSIQDLTGEP